VTGLGFDDVVDFQDMEDVNNSFLDNCVADGHLLMDVSYEFSGFDPKTKTVSVKVMVADIGEWVDRALSGD
jgi:hypothetical protein